MVFANFRKNNLREKYFCEISHNFCIFARKNSKSSEKFCSMRIKILAFFRESFGSLETPDEIRLVSSIFFNHVLVFSWTVSTRLVLIRGKFGNFCLTELQKNISLHRSFTKWWDISLVIYLKVDDIQLRFLCLTFDFIFCLKGQQEKLQNLLFPEKFSSSLPWPDSNYTSEENRNLGNSRNFPNSYGIRGWYIFKILEISQMTGYLGNSPILWGFGKFLILKLPLDSRVFGEFPRHFREFPRHFEEFLRHFVNSPDSQALGEFPWFPGIWEISKILRHLENFRNVPTGIWEWYILKFLKFLK